MADQIRYDLLTQQALRGVVRSVLTDAAKKGLPGDHHFFIEFDTLADGVRMSDRLRAQHPEKMTIILQHQFWDLAVSDTGFEVGLSFGGITERLAIPFDAISGFFDPSVQLACNSRKSSKARSRAARRQPTGRTKTRRKLTLRIRNPFPRALLDQKARLDPKARWAISRLRPHALPLPLRRCRIPNRTPSPTSPRMAAAKWFASIVSARSNGQTPRQNAERKRRLRAAGYPS